MASTPATPISFERFGKPHTFKTKTFKGLNWCELCGNFLWGFTAQGVKCEGTFLQLNFANTNLPREFQIAVLLRIRNAANEYRTIAFRI